MEELAEIGFDRSMQYSLVISLKGEDSGEFKENPI